MAMIRFLSKIEQVAAHLTAEMQAGRWGSEMPGRHELAAELGINGKTVEAALKQLEKSGMLVPQGAGRRRRIAAAGNPAPQGLRVGILHYERSDRTLPYLIDLMHYLQEAGHAAAFAEKSLQDLGMDVRRISRMVEKTAADAWVVNAGSRELLGWFATRSVPVFAVFGRFSAVPLAGIRVIKVPAMRLAVRRMVALGHRRIVLLTRDERRKPVPALFEQAFLDELAAHGIPSGPYNLPDWDNNRKDFHRCLDSLLQLTPPSAMIVDEAPLFIAAQQHLALRGVVAPRDISLLCNDPSSTFEWCDPEISHIHWDGRPVVRRVLRWASNVSRGRDDRRQSQTIAEFVEGGTIGPVHGRKC